MQSVNQQFILLINSGLWGTFLVPSNFVVVDWNALWNLIMKHCMSGVVADAVNLLPDNCKPSLDIRVRINYMAERCGLRHKKINSVLASIVNYMNCNGVHPI